MIKHHRREQSYNPTQTQEVRNARRNAEEERKAESCERPRLDEDYEILRGKNDVINEKLSFISQSPDVSFLNQNTKDTRNPKHGARGKQEFISGM